MFSFNFTHTPDIYFGPGKIKELPDLIAAEHVNRIVLITGGSSFRGSERWSTLTESLQERRVEMIDFSVRGEPSPDAVDEIVASAVDFSPEAVVSVGGGSVIDTGKAVSAMLPCAGGGREYPGVQTFLEEIGTEPPGGEKIVFVAVPTTSGTGSEATKNAVISRRGEGGFKKSLRHNNYVPNIALIDPELAASCPADITAASGLDAITQLIEGFVSTKASPITDSFATSGLIAAGRSFSRAVEDGERDLEARSHMAFAACMSGIVLANAGLGVVHGMAGYLGGKYPVSHGAACGTLLAKSTEVIIEKLFDLEEENNLALLKYGEAAKYVSGRDMGSLEDNCKLLVDLLYLWTEKYEIPLLHTFGITEKDCREIAEKSGRKNTPVELTGDDCYDICSHRL